MDERTEAERLAQARLAIAKRIKRVCEVFLPADFGRLLDQMARIQCKYDVLPAPLISESTRVRLSLGRVGNTELAPLAKEVKQRLGRVLDAVGANPPTGKVG
jgi:hypothetical protein